jgi:hypothetical protein
MSRTVRSGPYANRKFRVANRPPEGEHWMWLTEKMIASPAYRAASEGALKVLARVMLEHMSHGGCQNGALPVTYTDFETYNIRRGSILDYLWEAIALGLIGRTQQGKPSYGVFEGAAAQYRLTWLPTHDGAPATNEWSKIESLQDAEAIVRRSRADVEAHRKRDRLANSKRNRKRPPQKARLAAAE